MKKREEIRAEAKAPDVPVGLRTCPRTTLQLFLRTNQFFDFSQRDQNAG
jgi:hypothetical protein